MLMNSRLTNDVCFRCVTRHIVFLCKNNTIMEKMDFQWDENKTVASFSEDSVSLRTIKNGHISPKVRYKDVVGNLYITVFMYSGIYTHLSTI